MAKTIDYESGDTQFTVLVTVQDIYPPGASDTATVTVNIINVNDNNPKFNKTVYAASQDENTPAGTSIVRVSKIREKSSLLVMLLPRYSPWPRIKTQDSWD